MQESNSKAEVTLSLDIDAAFDAIERQAPGAELREKYVGASEVGACMRKVVHDRLHGPSHGTREKALMDTGSVLEAQSIKLLRAGAKGWEIKSTGHRQEEFVSPYGPLFSHPDAILKHIQTGTVWCCDVKRPNSWVLSRIASGEPIRPQWYDQAIAQAGTARDCGVMAEGTFLFIQANNDPTNFHIAKITFDEDRYLHLLSRATTIMEHVANATLPDGEPERGYCSSCAIRRECPAYTLKLNLEGRGATDGLPAETYTEIAGLLSELKEAETQLKPLEETVERLRTKLRGLMAEAGPGVYDFFGDKVSCSLVSKVTFDSKAFKKDYPELFSQYSKNADTFMVKVSWAD